MKAWGLGRGDGGTGPGLGNTHVGGVMARAGEHVRAGAAARLRDVSRACGSGKPRGWLFSPLRAAQLLLYCLSSRGEVARVLPSFLLLYVSCVCGSSSLWMWEQLFMGVGAALYGCLPLLAESGQKWASYGLPVVVMYICAPPSDVAVMARSLPFGCRSVLWAWALTCRLTKNTAKEMSKWFKMLLLYCLSSL